MYTICIGDDNVYNALETLTHKNGDRVIIIDIKHLADLKDFFGKLSQSDELNPFQRWITHDVYDFTLPNEQNQIVGLDGWYQEIPRNLKILISK